MQRVLERRAYGRAFLTENKAVDITPAELRRVLPGEQGRGGNLLPERSKSAPTWRPGWAITRCVSVKMALSRREV